MHTVKLDFSHVYALFKNGKLFRYGESSDPYRRLAQHIAQHGPLTMKVLPGGPYQREIAFAKQKDYIMRYFDRFGRLPPGNKSFS